VRFLEYQFYTRRVAEALRSHSRGSERVVEMYSPSALKRMRRYVFPTSTSLVPPHVLVVAGVGQYRLDPSLVTLERR
jgi:hypothetical protein